MRGKRQRQQRKNEVAGRPGQRQICFGSRWVGQMMQRDKEAEGKKCWRERRSMIRDQEPGPTWGWEEPHFVVILLWLVLRTVPQEQAYMLAQFSLSADSYHQLTKHIKLRRMNASVRRSAPVPSSLKRNLFMPPMKELWHIPSVMEWSH